jgi:hypothetical protein
LSVRIILYSFSPLPLYILLSTFNIVSSSLRSEIVLILLLPLTNDQQEGVSRHLKAESLKNRTMATFANQASNLSALGSKFDRLLKVPPDHNEEISSYFEGRLRSRGK